MMKEHAPQGKVPAADPIAAREFIKLMREEQGLPTRGVGGRAAEQQVEAEFKIDWEKVKVEARREKETQSPLYYLHYISEVRRFDPLRFDAEIGISEGEWKGFVTELKKRKEEDVPIFIFMKWAAMLHEMDPNRFTRSVRVEAELWDRVLAELKDERLSSFIYLNNYAALYEIDPKRTRENVPIDGTRFSRIKEEMDREGLSCPHCMVDYRVMALKAGLEEVLDLTVSREQFEKIKTELIQMFGRSSNQIQKLWCVNILRDLKIRDEKAVS